MFIISNALQHKIYKYFKIMGAETKKLAQVSYVTDTDVSYYEIGEVEGAFQEEQLKDYIKRFGHEKLCSQLGYMQFQIWRAVREINGERDSQDGAKYASCTNAT